MGHSEAEGRRISSLKVKKTRCFASLSMTKQDLPNPEFRLKNFSIITETGSKVNDDLDPLFSLCCREGLNYFIDAEGMGDQFIGIDNLL